MLCNEIIDQLHIARQQMYRIIFDYNKFTYTDLYFREQQNFYDLLKRSFCLHCFEYRL